MNVLGRPIEEWRAVFPASAVCEETWIKGHPHCSDMACTICAPRRFLDLIERYHAAMDTVRYSLNHSDTCPYLTDPCSCGVWTLVRKIDALLAEGADTKPASGA